jgi:hypothetical protein
LGEQVFKTAFCKREQHPATATRATGPPRAS